MQLHSGGALQLPSHHNGRTNRSQLPVQGRCRHSTLQVTLGSWQACWPLQEHNTLAAIGEAAGKSITIALVYKQLQQHTV